MQPQLVHFISTYGYLAIFLLIYIREVGFPLPNELLMLFTGYLVFKGALNFMILICFAVAADFIGAATLYFVFYFGGVYLLNRLPKWLPLSQTSISSMRDRVSSGGWWTIFALRNTPLVRGYISVICGLLHLRPKQYLPIAFGSSLIVCSFYITLGKILGNHWSSVAATLYRYQNWILATIVVFALLFLLSRFLRVVKKKEWMLRKIEYQQEG